MGVNINVQPGVVHAYLGTIADTIFWNRTTVLTTDIVTGGSIGSLTLTLLSGDPRRFDSEGRRVGYNDKRESCIHGCIAARSDGRFQFHPHYRPAFDVAE